MYIVQASPTVSILFHVSRLIIGITVAANKAQSGLVMEQRLAVKWIPHTLSRDLPILHTLRFIHQRATDFETKDFLAKLLI